jgi:hypothetical protein
MSRPLALAFVGWRTAVLIGAGLLRLGGLIPLARQRMLSAASGIGGGSTLTKLPAPTIRVAQSRVKSKEENVMNVLAIGRYASCAFDAYVPAEEKRVTELREEGFISDLFFKSDKSGPILVLNNTNRDEAQWRLATQPLVEADFLAFEQLIEFTTLRHVIDRGAVIRS